MATVGAVGGSQIDVQSLVSQLVAAERAPLDKQVTRDSTRVTTQISAVGALMGAMSTFRSALSSLKTVDVFGTRTAVSANAEVFTATASASAAPGEYDVEVVRLAKAHQISSDPFAAGASHVVGTGTLTLSLGDEDFSVNITDDNSTLAEIRDAINAATDNPGIRATLIHGAGGSRLVLTSALTGEDNAITVAQSGGNGGLAALTYSASATANYEQLSAAQDALVNVANAVISSSDNIIENAIDGVTLTLKAASDPDEDPTRLTVAYDRAAVSKRIDSFVSAYNALVDQISRLRSYDSASGTAGPMLGDSLVTGIESQLRRTITEVVGSANPPYQTLASIGITTQADGKLAVNSAKLNTALDSDFESVGRLFGSEQGIASKLFAQMDDRLKDGGAIDQRSETLVKQQEAIADRKDAIDARMLAKQQAYIQQFTRLDTLLSQLQVTSSYLTQQIESLGNLNKASST